LDLQDDASIQEIRRSIPGSSNFLYWGIVLQIQFFIEIDKFTITFGRFP
jgi:hypothetical protein